MRSSKTRGYVRIIAGKWRGQHLNIAHEPCLRPTPDRVRETLFNWLTGLIQDTTVCLDLFAGTGALGFEALSRGAKHVTFIDMHLSVIKVLEQHAIKLNVLNQCHIERSDSLRWLTRAQKEKQAFDLIFLDPPFSSYLVKQSIERLNTSPLVKKGTLIYIESPKMMTQSDLPHHWQLFKQQTAGDVAFHLVEVGMP